MNGLFFVWRKFQRRAEVLAPKMNAKIVYINVDWEDKSKFHKALSYLYKVFCTIKILTVKKPKLVIAQLPPVPLLYIVTLYAKLRSARLILDCHNSMIQGHWFHWPMVKNLLDYSITVVHNKFIANELKNQLRSEPFVLRTGFDARNFISNPTIFEKFSLEKNKYVVLPWAIAKDEPLEAAFSAMEMMKNTKFVLTWYPEKLPEILRKKIPSNLVLTGYLDLADFNTIFSNAGVALVLTTREGTQLSGMAEAMTLGVPAVISDLIATRFLYSDAAVFVKNESIDIVNGIAEAFANSSQLKKRMSILKLKTEQEFQSQLDQITSALNIYNE